jgi:immune inhibitor A
LFVLTAAVAAIAGCRGSSKPPAASPTASAVSVATLPPSPTATATPELAQEIGVRASLPLNDAIDLAARYGLTAGRAPISKPFTGGASVGDSREFFVSELTSGAIGHRTPPTIATVRATLLAKSAHAYFYADDSLGADPGAIQAAADDFEAHVWPVVTGAFGEPAIPGVDGDPRILVLQADLGGVGGYFTGDDPYLRTVRPLSNEAEIVYIDRTLRPGTAAFSVVLAHEFQHLIHAKSDPGEEVWVNEGLSEDALLLAGGAASTINSFQARPETQLNAWSISNNQPHYGAAAAFFRYLASRFGGDTSLGAIARSHGDGEAGVDEFLASVGQALRFRDVFADWIVANVLNEASGPYGNPDHKIALNIEGSLAPRDHVDAEAHQFGTDYYGLTNLGGDMVLRFHATPTVSVLPPAALAEGPVLWSNAEDDVDTTRTYEADLASAVAPALTFRTWYDIERWYDWGYVAASTDGGATWHALAGEHTTGDDPVKAAYGVGYNGTSGDGDEPAWVDERVDLSAYAGKKILLRFEYVTDGGFHGEGWAIRNVRLTASGGDAALGGATTANGWITLDRPLPQTCVVRLIEKRRDGANKVLDVPLDASGAGELRFSTAGLDDAILAVAGSTEGTDQLAPYSLDLMTP